MYEMFPSKKEFDMLYAPEGPATTEFSKFKLNAISYTQFEEDGGYYGLSGI